MIGTGLVYHKQIGSLLTRHSHIQSLIESLLLLHSGKCTLNVEYLNPLPKLKNMQQFGRLEQEQLAASMKSEANLNSTRSELFPGIICDEIRIANMGSGFVIMFIFVCEMMNHNNNNDITSRMLVKLEELDIELCSTGINTSHLYGIITDGHSRWVIIRRNNRCRLLAKDVLNDALLCKSKYFDLKTELLRKMGLFVATNDNINGNNSNGVGNKSKSLPNSGDSSSKFESACLSLATERFCLLQNKIVKFKQNNDNNESISLYDGCVLECPVQSTRKLQELSEALHGIISDQCYEFHQAFMKSIQDSNGPNLLNRPAMNPYHHVNIQNNKAAWKEYLGFCQKSQGVL